MAASDPATAFDRLVRVETLLWTRLDERLRAEHGIPLSWYEPMRVVEELGSARVRDIADRLIITEGGATGVLAASIFHFGQHTIAEAKAVMTRAGITVRPVAS